MANTTNLDLVKPAGTDHALISVLNSNSDKIDTFAGQTNDSLSAEQNGLAYIVGNTNTTGGTLAAGQFVYVKGHSTIAEGLRKVTSSISANGSITTSNTDACSEGGLNALNSKFAGYHVSSGAIESVTTNANGLVTPQTSISVDNVRIICAFGDFSQIVIPMVASSDNTWRFYVYNASLQPIANTNVSIFYLSMEK